MLKDLFKSAAQKEAEKAAEEKKTFEAAKLELYKQKKLIAGGIDALKQQEQKLMNKYSKTAEGSSEEVQILKEIKATRAELKEFQEMQNTTRNLEKQVTGGSTIAGVSAAEIGASIMGALNTIAVKIKKASVPDLIATEHSLMTRLAENRASEVNPLKAFANSEDESDDEQEGLEALRAELKGNSPQAKIADLDAKLAKLE
ncbi:MAG: hypothetical protein FWG63_08640 [Defluviitaleaceae bacterium]|nr:hypothetical protein [Defluviitaleaceae bacterium]